MSVGRNATAARFQEALQAVLGQPPFKQAASRLQKVIPADLAANRAVAELEALAHMQSMP